MKERRQLLACWSKTCFARYRIEKQPTMELSTAFGAVRGQGSSGLGGWFSVPIPIRTSWIEARQESISRLLHKIVSWLAGKILWSLHENLGSSKNSRHTLLESPWKLLLWLNEGTWEKNFKCEMRYFLWAVSSKMQPSAAIRRLTLGAELLHNDNGYLIGGAGCTDICLGVPYQHLLI